jgi:hypothetical protein
MVHPVGATQIYSAECVEKLSNKSLGGVSSVGIAAITRLNGSLLPASGPPETLVLELPGVFGQFRKGFSPKFVKKVVTNTAFE